ncbi:toll/interleukin-1 receptor domain-containing protein [Sorangium sp. So ce341]|uniref:toll/interleukin-1 receptor domain-containing protein n=1 Tax=Sorangium sp. So ce341 TaxID=3133302 RepID=UPI003F607FC8
MFISYAPADEALRRQLEAHLHPLVQQGLITPWHRGLLEAGEELDSAVFAQLACAHVILLLVSADFLVDDNCRVEAQQGIMRHEAGEARMVPIIVRPCLWIGAPWAKLMVLPAAGKAVTGWADRDEAWLNVVAGIQSALKQLLATNGNLERSYPVDAAGVATGASEKHQFSGSHKTTRIDRHKRAAATGSEQLVDQTQALAARLPNLVRISDPSGCPSQWVRILIPNDKSFNLNVRGARSVHRGIHFDQYIPDEIEAIAANVDAYPTFEDFLDDLYTGYLRARFEPYTYGKSWILAKASDYVTLLAVPWEWLHHKRARPLVDVIPNYFDRSTPLREFGLGVNSSRAVVNHWAVLDSGFEKSYGLFTSSERVLEQAFYPLTKKLLFSLRRAHVSRLQDVKPADYKYKLVVSLSFDYIVGMGEALPQDGVFIIE